ncbi:MAG TPA: hypothetical protein QGF58_04585 [Myxococcota bacterium]|nr:hypothetical protein [Myxococcota bacterium]
MTQRQIGESYDFSMSIGNSLFTKLLGEALPMEVKKGPFNLTENLRDAARQLQVKEKVAGLLEGPQNEALVRVKDRARDAWGNRREQVYDTLDRLVRVEGDWEIHIDDKGSEFKFAHQKLALEAHAVLVAHGTATLLDQNIEVPFRIEKRVGAEVGLGDIHYDPQQEAIVGNVKDVGIDLGENILLRIANDIIGKVIEAKGLPQVNPLTVLPKKQVDEAIGGATSALKLQMRVTDIILDINEEYVTLKVKFGFSQLQIEDHEQAARS